MRIRAQTITNVRHTPGGGSSAQERAAAAGAFFGIGAPKSTSAEIVERLNKEINATLADPKMKPRLADFGGTVLPGSPADFGKLIADETEKWAKVVKFSGARPD